MSRARRRCPGNKQREPGRWRWLEAQGHKVELEVIRFQPRCEPGKDKQGIKITKWERVSQAVGNLRVGTPLRVGAREPAELERATERVT